MPHPMLINRLKLFLQTFVLSGLFFSSIAPTLAQDGSYERFFIAIQRDDVRALQRLEPLGFDFNTPNPDLEPPLYLALSNESLNVARFLISRPTVDVNARGQADESPLMMAALRGHLDIVEALIGRQAQVNKPGWTPLHYAATHAGPNAPAITRLLLEHHAFIDAESPNKTTPLMMAAHYGHTNVVKILLEEGADPMARNQQGLTAIDFAHRAGRREVAELIAAFVRGKNSTGAW